MSEHEFGEISIILDEDLDGVTWRTTKDFRTDKVLIFVSPQVFDSVSDGIIPDGLVLEIAKHQNGGSPV